MGKIIKKFNDFKNQLQLDFNPDLTKFGKKSKMEILSEICRTHENHYLDLIIADIDLKSNSMIKPLMEACKSDNVEAIQYLVKNGFNIKSYGENPIIVASFYGSYNVVKYCLENGLFDNKSRLPLMNAVESDKIDTVDLLLNSGFELDKYMINKAKSDKMKNYIRLKSIKSISIRV